MEAPVDRRQHDTEAGASAPIPANSWLSEARTTASERLDPHVYAYGVNGLTVREATERAFFKVLSILGRSGEEYSRAEKISLYKTIGACLIAQVRRDNLYRIAGILVADRRDEGVHLEYSMLDAYIAAVREVFLRNISVGETVLCPEGLGEVRYVSGDCSMAVVSLYPDSSEGLASKGLASDGSAPDGSGEDGSGREIFCEMKTLSRPRYDPAALRAMRT